MHACFVNAMFGKRGADESFKATLGQHHWSLFKVRIKPQVAGSGGAGAYRAKISSLSRHSKSVPRLPVPPYLLPCSLSHP